MICCTMWKKTRLLLLILPLISSLFFLSNFQISKNFISPFSETERPTKLNLDGHWVHNIYLNQAAGAYLFLYCFNFLSLQFQNINFLSQACKVKLDTHMGNGLIYCVHQNQAASTYMFFIFLLFLSLQLANIKNLHLQNCFNIPRMAMAGGMWALLTVCYICIMTDILWELSLDLFNTSQICCRHTEDVHEEV